jgi:hypothetical protein
LDALVDMECMVVVVDGKVVGGKVVDNEVVVVDSKVVVVVDNEVADNEVVDNEVVDNEVEVVVEVAVEVLGNKDYMVLVLDILIQRLKSVLLYAPTLVGMLYIEFLMLIVV